MCYLFRGYLLCFNHPGLFFDVSSVYRRYACEPGGSNSLIWSGRRFRCSTPLHNAKYRPHIPTIVSSNVYAFGLPRSPSSHSRFSSSSEIGSACFLLLPTRTMRTQILHLCIKNIPQKLELRISEKVNSLSRLLLLFMAPNATEYPVQRGSWIVLTILPANLHDNHLHSSDFDIWVNLGGISLFGCTA